MMQNAIDLALARHVAYVYVTDDSPDGEDVDPWNRLPAYWDAEVSLYSNIKSALIQVVLLGDRFNRQPEMINPQRCIFVVDRGVWMAAAIGFAEL